MDKTIRSTYCLEQCVNEVSMENTCLDFKWKFEVENVKKPSFFNRSNCDKQGWFVSVTFERLDINTNVIGIGRGRKEYISFGSTESAVVKTCWLLIELVVRHELMEAFKWKNKRIFNPHNSVYELAKIQN